MSLIIQNFFIVSLQTGLGDSVTWVCFGVGTELYVFDPTVACVTLFSRARLVQCTLTFKEGNTKLCDGTFIYSNCRYN